ncbi:MAG TPA: hypothetical protein VGL08_18010 [Paraburkholderia sp.]
MFADERRGQLSTIVMKSLEDFTGTPNRRSLMRLLEHQVAPRLERLGLEPYVGAIGAAGQAEGLFVNFVTMSAEHGLREFQLQVTVPDMVLSSFASNTIKPHAVARCMQRNGVLSLAEIERETSSAFVLTRALRALAQAEHWKQAAVPTSDGLFVGDVMNNGDFHMNTYFRPSVNDRPSRWSGFAELFSAMPRWSATQIHEGSDLLQWMVNHILVLRKAAPLAERFPFLLKPYESVDDPLDATWDAARASASARADAKPPLPAAHSDDAQDSERLKGPT